MIKIDFENTKELKSWWNPRAEYKYNLIIKFEHTKLNACLHKLLERTTKDMS